MKERAVRQSVQMVHFYEDNQPEEPLVDLTATLAIHSKRTERQKKKQRKKEKAPSENNVGLLDLPYEILSSIFTLLRPRDLTTLSFVNRPLHHMILGDEEHLAKQIIEYRYACLAQCFRLPALIRDVDPAKHGSLLANLQIPKKYYQHIQAPDSSLVCTCMTCLNRWNCLCLALDFHHWQSHLDKGQPISIIPRGANPEWNQALTGRNADMVVRALTSTLVYAIILELHLDSTVRSIGRHGLNKSNRRVRFRMTGFDMKVRTDAFLERSGPPTIDFPYHRDNYYLLEAFLPNRSWIQERNQWVYMPADQHDKDVDIAVLWAAWRKKKAGSEAQTRGQALLAASSQARAGEQAMAASLQT